MKITLTSSICLLIMTNAMAYQSTYDKIQWEQRGTDTNYCIDITDKNWNIYPDLQAIACGENLYSFSPSSYVHKVMQQNPNELSGTTFRWRVWSPNGYGDKGFEGEVTVGSDCGLPYHSDAKTVQWNCRFDDSYYCLDLFDAAGQIIKAPLVCGENMHSFSPHNLKRLNLPSDTYHWKVWSHNAYDYNGHQEFFEGKFEYNKQDSDGSAEWEHDDENGSVAWTDDGECSSGKWDYGNGSGNWNNCK